MNGYGSKRIIRMKNGLNRVDPFFIRAIRQNP